MSKNYVNNKDLYKKVIISQGTGDYTPLWEPFLLIAERYQTTLGAKRSDELDIRHGAVLEAISKVERFDSDRTQNAFAFFTSVIKNGLYKSYKDLYYHNGQYRFDVEINLFSRDFDNEE